MVAAETVQRFQIGTRNNDFITRIWPLDKLVDVPTLSNLIRPKYYKEILMNRSFVDPTTLVGIKTFADDSINIISKVVTKALGSYILCDNEKDAINVMTKYQSKNKSLCIVTTDGVIHRSGSLFVSETCSDQSKSYDRIGSLEDYQKSSFEVKELTTLCGTIKKQIDQSEGSIFNLIKLNNLMSEVKVLSQKIRVSNNNLESSISQKVHDNFTRDTMILRLENTNSDIKRLHKELGHICECFNSGAHQEHEVLELDTQYKISQMHRTSNTKHDLEQKLLFIQVKRLEVFNSLESLENLLYVTREKQNLIAEINKELMETKSKLVSKGDNLKQKLTLLMSKSLDNDNTVRNNILQEKRLSHQHSLHQLYAIDFLNLIQRYECFVRSITTSKHFMANSMIHLAQLDLFNSALHFQKEIGNCYNNTAFDIDSKRISHQTLVCGLIIDKTAEILSSLPLDVDIESYNDNDNVELRNLPCNVDECLNTLAIKKEVLQTLMNEECIINNSSNNRRKINSGLINFRAKKIISKRKRNPTNNDSSEYDTDNIKSISALDTNLSRNLDYKHILEALRLSILLDKDFYCDLSEKYSNVTNAIVQLSNGIKSISDVVKLKLSNTFQAIRTRVRTYFHDLVPNKQCDLIPIDHEDLGLGVKFVLVELNVSNLSINELSGGQKGLLSLAFVFALCNLRPSPLYLLDEVDAALDEENQHMIAEVIANFFKHSQVLCVSHRIAMQSRSDSSICVQIKNGRTTII